MGSVTVSEIIATFFPRVFTTRRAGVLSGFIVLALVNLGTGLVLATWVERQMDLATVHGWLRQWLVDGSNIYAATEYFPDYPPNAIVALSPIGLLPLPFVVAFWIGLNVALAVAAPFLAFRAIRPDITWPAAAIPITMCLAWGGFRTLLQFTSLALVLGLACMLVAPKRPRTAGVLLGLALIKPQVAIPFVIWAAFTRRWRVLAVAVICVAAGIALFCMRANVSPVEVIERYIAILGFYYFGDGSMSGLSELRPLLVAASTDFRTTDVLAAAVALVMLLVIAATGVFESRKCGAVYFAAPPLVALWSLLTFYQLTYGFIVLLPLAAALVLASDRSTLLARRTVFWVLYIALVLDVPTLVRRLGPALSAPGGPGDLLLHFDRALFAAIFVTVAMLGTKCHN